MFNASFHHFDDKSAIGVLKSVISEADAFVYDYDFHLSSL